jgi:riboflavin transporter FmnP
MWAKVRRVAVVSILVTIGAVAAMLAPFPIPFRGWLRGDRDEVPTELVAEESRPGG